MAADDINIGQVLLINDVVTQGDLTEALAVQAAAPNRKLGEILVSLGKITEATLNACLKKQDTLRAQGATKDDVHAAIDFAHDDSVKVSSEIDGMIEELTEQLK